MRKVLNLTLHLYAHSLASTKMWKSYLSGCYKYMIIHILSSYIHGVIYDGTNTSGS